MMIQDSGLDPEFLRRVSTGEWGSRFECQCSSKNRGLSP